MIGHTLSHYEITAKLGEGGMGEVWRATDTSLNREVAVKVLPEEMAADSERLERFKREAQAIAALNHPNIVTIYSVEEAGGVHLLTMELVEGESLDQVLPAQGFGVDRLFPLWPSCAAPTYHAAAWPGSIGTATRTFLEWRKVPMACSTSILRTRSWCSRWRTS
jgi:serine/threonine protein kinase